MLPVQGQAELRIERTETDPRPWGPVAVGTGNIVDCFPRMIFLKMVLAQLEKKINLVCLLKYEFQVDCRP